jgi:hypothetical protein
MGMSGYLNAPVAYPLDKSSTYKWLSGFRAGYDEKKNSHQVCKLIHVSKNNGHSINSTALAGGSEPWHAGTLNARNNCLLD